MFCWGRHPSGRTGGVTCGIENPCVVRVEHLEQPVGIPDRRPRLSWQLPSDAGEQRAYELRLDDGTTTGRVDSAQNVLVGWPGSALSSRERRQVQVRVWTDRGESPWSAPTELEAGLLAPADWVSSWVEPAAMPGTARVFGPRISARRGAPRRSCGRRPAVRHRARIYEIHLTAAGSATSNWRPVHRVRRTHAGPDVRRHGPAPEGGTRSAPCWPTGGTAEGSACCGVRPFGDRTLCSPSCTRSSRRHHHVAGTGRTGPAQARTSWRPT